ncbi:hypothetical protein BH23ACT5_BH23ACT5_02430 [soil metagenome]
MTRPGLEAQLDDLPDDLRSELTRFGFDRSWFLEKAGNLAANGPGDNRVSGEVTAPAAGDIVDLPPEGSTEHERLARLGSEALAAGQCALVVLAGGMATRMGGVVKALVEALPGKSFLDLRLDDQRATEAVAGHVVPLWLMTSHSTERAIREALAEALDGYRVATFPQRVSLRLDQTGVLFLDDNGRPSEHAPGHGDLPEALQNSGLLDSFVAKGGRHVMVANLDNLGASLEPVVIGFHLDSQRPVTCEVVDKEGSDRGGIPARLDGRPVILEEFRIPEAFDASSVPVFNTNSFHFDARALKDLDIEWTYFAVEKDVDGSPAIQFERLVNEVTFVLDATYLRVPRHGSESRYLPVKDQEELLARRADIEAVARRTGSRA